MKLILRIKELRNEELFKIMLRYHYFYVHATEYIEHNAGNLLIQLGISATRPSTLLHLFAIFDYF